MYHISVSIFLATMARREKVLGFVMYIKTHFLLGATLDFSDVESKEEFLINLYS